MSVPKPARPAGATRRRFLKSAVAVAGLAAARPAPVRAAGQTLALKGGTPAVNFPADRFKALTHWPRYGPEEKKIVAEMLDCDCASVYDIIPVLEQRWRDYHKVPYAKLFCNGTSALTAMYFALDLPAGSEIMVPSYTFFGTILPMRFFGLVPIFIDLDPRTACFDVEDAARKLTPRTKALVPMHSWGMPCDMDRICAFAREHGLIVCEDAAHAHGASLQGIKMGAWGETSIVSFQATKPLPGIEGGAGLYKDRTLYERANVFGDYKAPARLPADSPYRIYEGTGLGLKLRIHPLAAALVNCQLDDLDRRNELITAQVRRLNERICQLPGVSEPFCRPDARRVYYSSNLIFIDEAQAGCPFDRLLEALRAEGVAASSGDYPEQHKLAVYREAKWWHHPVDVPASLPGTEQVNRTAVNLPLLRDEAPELIDMYIAAFEKVWAHRKELA